MLVTDDMRMEVTYGFFDAKKFMRIQIKNETWITHDVNNIQ